MKKPAKNIDAFAAKRNSRVAKKTVLTIAPVETQPLSYSEPIEDSDDFACADDLVHTSGMLSSKQEYGNSESKCAISTEMALSFSCEAMASSLRWKTWELKTQRDSAPGDEIDVLLKQFEDASGVDLAGTNVASRLTALIALLHRGALVVRRNSDAEIDEHATKLLTTSLHALVAAECQQRRFDEAVELASQRAIYQFAYGLTHEINNPLANIAARAQQLIAAAGSDSDRRSLATIVDQSMRAHEMLAEMMRVVQPRSLHPRVEDVIAILKEAIEIQRKQWALAQVSCTLKAPANPLYGAIDREAMLEAINSLLQNAMQICRPNDRIEVMCEEVASDHADFVEVGASIATNVETSSQIRIAIRDTGPGMSSQTLERAWDLYFSGREHGRGLGISLAKVRQTIDAHQGSVWIESKPAAGCTVEVRLPKLPSPPNPRKTISI